MTDSRLNPITRFLLPLTAAAVLTLGACSSGGTGTTTEPATTAPAATQTVPETTETAPESTETAPETTQVQESSEPAATTSATKGGTLDQALAAINTVKDQGEVVEIDFDKTQWKLDVVKNNAATKIKISTDGAKVLSTTPTDFDDDDAAALKDAKISMAEALNTALAEVPGTIDEAELEHHKGKAAYSVEVYPEDGSRKRDVHVDAATGEVLEVTDED